MKTCRILVLLLFASLGFWVLQARGGTWAGSGDPFTFNFDEAGNGVLDPRDGTGFQLHNGALEPDPSQSGHPLVLTYHLPTAPLPLINGDVRIWEDAGGTILSDVIRFTDGAGNLSGQTADRMIFYSLPGSGNFADTGLPLLLLPNDAGGIFETGSGGNTVFQWAPGGAFDNIFNGISEVPEPGTLALLGLGATGFLVRHPRNKRRPAQFSR